MNPIVFEEKNGLEIAREMTNKELHRVNFREHVEQKYDRAVIQGIIDPINVNRELTFSELYELSNYIDRKIKESEEWRFKNE